MKKNLIVDWHGTVNDGMDAFFFIIEYIFRKNRLEPIPPDQIRQRFDIPYMGFWELYAPQMTKQQQDIWYREGWEKAPEKKIYPGVRQELEQLKKDGANLFVLSSDYEETLIPEAEDYGIKELFTDIHCGVHDKGIGLTALVAKHALSHRETVYIGDTAGDMRAARAAGVTPIGITWGIHPAEKLKAAGAYVTIDDFADLRQKVQFVTNP